MVSIKEVAARAGVSVATVSRVLNHNPHVKAASVQRVQQAMAELHYEPSGIAANMRRQSSRVIGLLISDIQNPFYTALVRAVEDVAYASGYTILLCNSDEDPAKEALYIEVLARERAAGMILVPTGQNLCEPLIKRRVPVVTVDRRIPGLATDQVVLDNYKGAYLATEHLIKLGHRRIGLVGAPLSNSVGLERRQGYECSLAAHGLPVDRAMVAIGDFKEKGGYAAALALLDLDEPPTAIFAVNNLMTMGLLRAVHERARRIPSDVSIVGFDDGPWLPLLSPPVTTVCQPTYELGAQAARLLIQRLVGDRQAPPQSVVLEPTLIVRGSTAEPAR